MTASEVSEAPVRWQDLLTRAHAPALALVCMGVWLHAADSLLVATMLPAIVADIGGIHLMPWTVALYEVGSIVAGAASGLLALRHGTRLPMAIAAAVFATGCVLSAVAPAMWLLLAGRLLQGLGGGGLMAMSFVSVGVLFPKRLLARVMGAVSTIWAVSAFLGPLVGGLFVELATWRAGFWCFAMQAIGLAAWIGFAASDRAAVNDGTASARFPLPRLLWLSAGVVLVASAGIDVAPLRSAAFVAAGCACLIVFLRLDARGADSRLLPPQPLNLVSPVGAALVMILCFTSATIAIGIYVPLIVTLLHGVSALVAGYVIAVESVAWALAAACLSGAAERHDGRLIVTGMCVVTLSIVGLAWSVGHGPIWTVALCAVMQGLGFGMAWTFILRRATSIAPVHERERVTAAIPTIQRVGYALGAAYVGVVANAAGIDQLTTHAALPLIASLIFAACLPPAALGLVAAYRFTR